MRKVKYNYDAWGNCTIASQTTDAVLARVNPIRYRGYYYDAGTGLYYLNARYYNPQWRRFISPDSTEYIDPEAVNGLNRYAYCNNDPINYADPSGHSWKSFWNGVGNWFEDHWVELAVGTLFIVGGAIVTAVTCGAGTTAWAALGSALLSSAIQTGASVAVGVGVNGLVNIANGKSFFDDVGDTVASSYMWGGILSGASQMLSGGFRLLRAKTGFTGIDNAKVGLMSPDKLYYDRPGMTLLRLGSRSGTKKIALDLGRYGIHSHLFSNLHTPTIPFFVGLIEAF
ncbi:MAG: RHS repeat-associated core domain-containing protein [Clostridia bacterium]|nr:RHS repeat-associated core domain-containing protein [Clostridia bacterium]